MLTAVLNFLGIGKRARVDDEVVEERAASRPKTEETEDEVVMAPVAAERTEAEVTEEHASASEVVSTVTEEVAAAEEEEEEEEAGIDVSTLPTLTESYVLGTLVAPTAELHSHDSALNSRLVLWRGDITTLKVDAIVNAANKALLGGGGVDGAIHSAAGPGLVAECRLLNGAQTGESKITAGHNLPASHVIHTVGPIYSRSKKVECERKLRSCYETTLQLAVDNGLKSLAFSGISTGIYGYPLDDASRVALDTIRTFLSSPAGASLETVVLTVFRSIDVDTYVKITPQYFPPAASAQKEESKVAEGETAAEEVEQ